MMTSGAKVHYSGMADAAGSIIKAEGVKSLFKGAGANILSVQPLLFNESFLEVLTRRP